MEKINLKEKFSLINEQWSPKIVAELNDSYVKIAKIQGEFTWHKHDKEDEMFFLSEGSMEIHFRDRVIALEPGEIIVVPKGVEHKPVCKDEAKIMMIEKKSTINTGDVINEKTKKDIEWI